ncbi:hypothetical protein FOBRF1_004344 [Fusarium oxysporum]
MLAQLSFFARTLSSVSLAAPECKNHPLDANWPRIDDWNALNRSISGALIQTRPVASSCHANSPFKSTISCNKVEENWFYSHFHSTQPESIGYPYWANASCVPPNDYAYNEMLGCELGGLPAYVVNATSSEQIAIAAQWASLRNIRINVKGTGHDLNGRSSGAHSLSIWTYHLHSIKFDPDWILPLGNGSENAIIVQSGNTWGNVLKAAAKIGRTVISGQDGTVGLGGFIGGGGHGPLSSHYGLSADHVLQATVVTTEGKILIANEAQNQDLLWAIRGGGPSSYGIVVEYVLRTVPLPKNVVMSTFSMSIIDNSTARAAQDSWTSLAAFSSSLPDLMDHGVTGYGFGITKQLPSSGSSSSADRGVELTLTLYGYNTTAAKLTSLLEPVRDHMLVYGGNKTISVDISKPEVLSAYLSLFDALNPQPSRSGDISLSSSRLLGRRHLTDIPLSQLRDHLQEVTKAQVVGRETRMVYGLQGGLGPKNVERKMRGGLNPAWRSAYLHLMTTGVNVETTGSTPHDALNTAAAWAEENKEAVWRKWAPDTGAYVNEANPFTRDFQQVFYGDYYDRLLKIKEKYDPSSSLLGDKYWEDGERQQEAIATYSKVFDLGRSIHLFSSFSDVLQKSSMAGFCDPMITFFERLLDEPQDGPNAAGEFLMDRLLEPGETFLSLLVKLFETSARYDLLETLFVRAIAKATSRGDQDDLFTIRYYYDKTLFSIKDHEEAGIAVWELYKSEATTELHEWAVNLIDTYMVPAWLELATAKDVDPTRAQGLFDKIEAAYIEFEALESHDIEPTVAFAQYFRYRGDTDKAKQILQPRVTEALEMLSDNDLYSLYNLGHILAVMRDLPNHIACMDLMRLALRIARAEYTRAVANYEAEDIQMEIAMAKGETFIRSFLSFPDEPEAAFFWCDGCQAEITFASEIWTCLSESGSIQLDDKCYKKLKEGRLGPVCSKEHEHYWVSKRNVEEIDAVPVGSVKLREEIISFEAWKDKIREQYVSSGIST